MGCVYVSCDNSTPTKISPNQHITMEGWTIAFIILCLVWGPVVVAAIFLGLAARVAPGTREDFPGLAYTAAITAMCVPFGLVGYMAFRKKVET